MLFCLEIASFGRNSKIAGFSPCHVHVLSLSISENALVVLPHWWSSSSQMLKRWKGLQSKVWRLLECSWWLPGRKQDRWRVGWRELSYAEKQLLFLLILSLMKLFKPSSDKPWQPLSYQRCANYTNSSKIPFLLAATATSLYNPLPVSRIHTDSFLIDFWL